jgi:hypothetical protein
MRLWPFGRQKQQPRQTLAERYKHFREQRESLDKRVPRRFSDTYWWPRFHPGTPAASPALAQISAGDFASIAAPLKKAARNEETHFTAYQKKAKRWRGCWRTLLFVIMLNISGGMSLAFLAEGLTPIARMMYSESCSSIGSQTPSMSSDTYIRCIVERGYVEPPIEPKKASAWFGLFYLAHCAFLPLGLILPWDG